MVDVATIANLTKETIRELTNVVGIIEKNLASYDRIKERFRRRRIAKRLIHILNILTSFRDNNLVTIMGIVERMQQSDENNRRYSALYLNEKSGKRFQYDDSVRAFFESLVEAKDVIDEYKLDILTVDYALYEELDDAISRRLDMTELLREDGRLSYKKMQVIYDSYVELVSSIDILKERVQSAARNEGTARA
jgi:hypothetical protein